MEQVRGLYLAFAEHSHLFRIEMVGVTPYLADLKSVGREQKVEEVLVELKERLCRLTGSGRSQVLRFGQNPQWDLERLTFSWKSQWDFIYPTVADMPRKAFVLPRDEIPLEWLNARPYNEELSSEVTTDFQDYAVDTSGNRTTAEGFERIIASMEGKTGSMKAKREIPTQVSKEANLAKKYQLRQSSDSELWVQCWSTNAFQRGFGSAEHGDTRALTYGQFASEVLIEICRAMFVVEGFLFRSGRLTYHYCGKSVVCDFGVWNPICRYAIARYPWSPEDKEYYDLHREPPKCVWNVNKETLVVPLDFTHMTWTGHDKPRGIRRAKAMWKDSRKRSEWPRLIVLDLFSIKCTQMAHGRFVVPSECLGKITHGKMGFLQDNRGVSDQYYVEQGDLIEAVTAPLQDGSQFTVCSVEEAFQVANYCSTVEEIHQKGLVGVTDNQQRKPYDYKG
ncbi:MAG: hypothetical protein Q9170_000678 [Blastenia crenularia]